MSGVTALHTQAAPAAVWCVQQCQLRQAAVGLLLSMPPVFAPLQLLHAHAARPLQLHAHAARPLQLHAHAARPLQLHYNQAAAGRCRYPTGKL
jgi:hypothetical protein